MLSAVIRSRHSYGAVPLARQPPDQRSVHFGPLVLETNLLKNQRLQQIKTNLSHACHLHSLVKGEWFLTHYCVHWTVTSSVAGRLTFSLYGYCEFQRGREGGVYAP